ncbi:MAG: low molecular weight protein arginine phosphatase [Clostridia bacterium]
MKKIMFVCTGNVCRSPMAHFYMKKRVEELGIENLFLIDSCGIFAITGAKSTANAVVAISEYGVDLKKGRAKNIKDIDIQDYDYIFCMTIHQRESIKYMYPSINKKIFTLKEFVLKDEKYLDIDDPWGYNLRVFKVCAKEIVKYVDLLLNKLIINIK